MDEICPGVKLNTRNSVEPQLIGIVDDDKAVRDAVGNLLESSGFGVKAFASVEEFLQSCHLYKMVCLILDVRLPGLGGLDIQSRLPEEERSIPTVFITAHADEDVRQQALRAGAVAFLYKPFSAEALLHAVRSSLK